MNKILTFLKFLNPSDENKKTAKNKLSHITQEFWNPTKKLNQEIIKNNATEIFSKYETLKENPTIITKQKRIGIIIIILGSILSILLSTITSEGSIAIIGIIFSSIYYILVTSYYKNLTIDLIKAQIAIEKHWLYNPFHNHEEWNNLKIYFPEIFSKGNKNQFVEDQFWGTHTNQHNKTTHFTTGKFEYTIETGSGKNRNSTTYHRHYFIFSLDKTLKSKFHLYPEGLGSKIGNLFSKKEINTESIEFNKTYAFSYNGKKGEQALHIIQALSPAVQEKLITLAKLKKDTNILFAHNTITFYFQGHLFNNPKTNLEKNLQLNPEDKQELENNLNNLIEIATEVAKYLN